MHIFDWIPLPSRFRRPPKPAAPGRLCCSECGGGIHRHDRYVILSARHRNCGDPKLVGQRTLTLPLEKP